MWYQVSPVRIRLSAPEIKNRPTGVFLFLCKDTDSNRGSHTLSLSLRRSTINVENVGVRLWQSSAICLRAFVRSAFLFTGSPRFARDESEYVKTSNAKFEQLRGYPQASAEGIRVYEVKRSANRINTRIRTGRNAPERHTHESRVNHPVDYVDAPP